ncbi:MAG: hypothetical protein HYS83_02485 [Candidatus Blackburnbacteria bacterium]|nr:hypothetical protein [Candidatus Blackburnbacteria bacterium]
MEKSSHNTTYGTGPIAVLALIDIVEREKIEPLIVDIVKKLPNITLVICSNQELESLQKFIQGQERPFTIIVDLSRPGNTLGGDGPLWQDVIKKSIGEKAVAEAIQEQDALSLWYSVNFELSTARVGKDRATRIQDLYKILFYLNGK